MLQPILFLPLFFTIPALAFAAIWFLGQILGGTMALFGPEGGGVAWGAPIGGFNAGVFLGRGVGAGGGPAPEQRGA
ncbi:MAG TPA: hypothetical protein PJ982_18040, partial [Lacipirellulaceae bacterium]|nr:hypothetical protein [Lacipirellulaceae bacterium]